MNQINQGNQPVQQSQPQDQPQPSQFQQPSPSPPNPDELVPSNPVDEQPEQPDITSHYKLKKKYKGIVLMCMAVIIVLVIMFIWSMVRLGGCDKAYEEGYNVCMENVKANLGSDTLLMPNISFDTFLNGSEDIANMGVIS